jgi:hypothetical protein
MRIATSLTATLTRLLAAPAFAAEATQPVNLQINYPTFENLVRDLGPIREAHRLT